MSNPTTTPTGKNQPQTPAAKPQTNAPGKPAASPPAATKPSAAPPSAPSTPTATSAGTEPSDGKGKRAKKERVRLVSPSNPKLWARMFKDVMEAHGKPRDADGREWEVRKGVSFGMSAEERAKRAADKDAEKARIEAMSPEERTAHLRAKREALNAKKEVKLETERKEREGKLRIGVYLDLLGQGIDIGPLVEALEKEGTDVSVLRAKMAERAATKAKQ